MWEPLTSSEIDAFIEGTFSLDSLHMELRPRSPDVDQMFVGPGTVDQDPEGRLHFVLFHQGADGSRGPLLPRPLRGEITEEDYFDLILKDTHGREWRAEHVIPECGPPSGDGLVCRGEIQALRCQQEVDSDAREELSEAIGLVFPGTYDLPANVATQHETREGDDLRRRAVRHNIWSFEGETFRYRFKNRDDGAMTGTVLAKDGAKLPDGLAWRMEEALWVVLFDRPLWSLRFARMAGTELVSLERPQKLSGEPRLEPLTPRREAPEDASQLFLDYLDYLSGYEEPRYHPTSVGVRRAIQASTYAVDSEARALAIEIEGLLRRDFSEEEEPDPEVLQEVEALEDHLSDWSGSERMERRVEGFLNRMRQPDRGDALEQLKDEGMITEEQYNAWWKLRGPTAHGRPIDRPISELVRLCDHLHHLLYFLVFYAVGYEGLYVHRVHPHREVREFPPERA